MSLEIRRDSGELRLFISIIISFVSLAFLYAGYKLILSGTAGSWAILSSFRGLTLYITSISPGLLVIVLAAVILFWGLPKILEKI